MDWTDEQTSAYLLRLPWTVAPETTPEGDRLLRVAEIPSAVGNGDTDAELEQDFWEALRASLEAYLHFGDPLPLPAGCIPPWEKDLHSVPPPTVYLVRKGLAPSESEATAGAGRFQLIGGPSLAA
jgi:predicted RNase H-like HicB family nuclease